MAKIVQNELLTPEYLAELSQDDRDFIYNALDCAVTLEVFEKQLTSHDEVSARTAAFSHSLAAPILEMNLRGTLIDEGERQRVLQLFRGHRAQLESQFFRIIFEGLGLSPPFNWRSNPQLMFLFYKVLCIHPHKARNSKGMWAPTMNREALEKVEQYSSARILARHVMAMRDYDKRIQFLESEVDSDHRMRTSYNVAGTNTGRLSSSTSDEGTGGNQQNIERALRRMYVPDPGWKFCNIDLEQADARNVGAICWDLFLDSHGPDIAGRYLDACESGDLHTSVCRMAWSGLGWVGDSKLDRKIADGVAYRTLSYRDMAKKLGHGTNYYGTPRTMAAHTKMETAPIKEFQQKYFAGFPCIGSFHDSVPEKHKALQVENNWHAWVFRQINEYGSLTTPLYGRRRFFFGRPDDDKTLREAIAYCPQSMTADAIDTGLIALWRLGLFQCLIQVHDSILFQYPAEREEELLPTALKAVQQFHTLKGGRIFTVPLEAKVGWNWADQSKDNPNGLIKWKGIPDLRPRPKLLTPVGFSLAGALDAR
jgi:DNA polymerase I-like protein with 3'-5' exonuclease and polymerase domains